MNGNIAKKIEAEAKKELNDTLDYAINSPEPGLESVFQTIYVEDGGKGKCLNVK